MSVSSRRRLAAALVAVAAGLAQPGAAHAGGAPAAPGKKNATPDDAGTGTAGAGAADVTPRFFAYPPSGDNTTTAYDGSVTSTTYALREFGGTSAGLPGLVNNRPPVDQASPVNRVYSDLRTRLDAKHIDGSRWDARVDLRMRVAANDIPFASSTSSKFTYSGTYQAGRFGGSEYDARELYVIRRGEHTDVSIGRQYSLSLAATKFDGLKVVHRLTGNWRLIGFGGLYPARGSRSITTDYPQAAPAPGATGGQLGSRIFPATAGAGAAYSYDSIYGAFGAVGIAPFATDQKTSSQETPRTFFTTNGYWRPDRYFDVYHYAVVDATGAAGPNLTNLSLGANFKPVSTVHIEASYDHVDTETLDVIAQARLDQPVGDLESSVNAGEAGYIQNNVTVSRIAQDEGRLSLSVALDHGRFEVSTIGRVRRRPGVTLTTVDNKTVSLPAGQAADITLRGVDRHSFAGFRLEARLTAIMGIGTDVNRAQSRIVALDGYRHFAGDKGNLDLSLRYLNGADDNTGQGCDISNIQSCYGASTINAATAGGVVYYRFKPSWYAMVGINAGVQLLATQYDNKGAVSQSPMFIGTGFGQVAYRF